MSEKETADSTDTEKDTEKVEKKRPAHWFKPGQSGNPSGGPKKKKELTIKCRAMTDRIMKRLMKIISYGKKDGDAVRAAQLVLAYAYGSPSQVVEIEAGERPLQVIAAAAMSAMEWQEKYQKALEERVIEVKTIEEKTDGM